LKPIQKQEAAVIQAPHENPEKIRLHFWNDSAGAIFLMVIVCQGVMELGVYALSMRTTLLAAHLLMGPVVATLATVMGSQILTSQRTLRKQLLSEIQARDLGQQKQSELARELKQILAEREAHNERLLSFSEFTHKLLSCTSESDIYEWVPKYGSVLFPNAIGAIYRPETGGQWKKACGWPEINGLLARFRLDRTSDSPEIVAKELVKALRTGISSRRSLALPVVAGKELLAVIYLEMSGPAEEQQSGWKRIVYMGTAFCEEISLAFANLRLRCELSRQAIRDPLTGLFNRRYMEEALTRELKRAERYHTSLSVLMIDLDHFKLLNDQFGHSCGDAVLKGLGGTILWHSRDEDIACRYGGEEILVVLPNTATEGAVAKANQLRSYIKKLASVTKYRRQITASIGIASYPQGGLHVEALVKSADDAMYTAKRLGRNRVCRANELAMTSG
jgi:diguanylate cyclase (GGDEF)-like protein